MTVFRSPNYLTIVGKISTPVTAVRFERFEQDLAAFLVEFRVRLGN